MICLGIYEIPAGMREHDAAHALCARMYGDLVGEPIPEIRVSAGGKPYFADSDVRFSLSHTNGLAVCVLSVPGIRSAHGYTVLCPTASAPDVGVDAERVRALGDTPRLRRIAGRFFPREERARLSLTGEGEYPAAFCDSWTRLESYVKMTGRGIRGGFPQPEDRVCFTSLPYGTEENDYVICAAYEAEDAR